MRAILCHNPKSGDADHSQSELVALLKSAGIESVYCNIKSDDFLKRLSALDKLLVSNIDETTKRAAPFLPHPDFPVWPNGTEVALIRRASSLTQITAPQQRR